MKITLDLASESVGYKDLGVDPAQRRMRRFRPRRRRGPYRKRIQKKDRYSVMQREARNLRSKILSRLDKVKYREGSPQEIQEARKEARSFYMEYKRKVQMLQRLPKPKRR